MSDMLVRESSELIVGDGRTVVVQLAKWGEPRTVSDDGETTYREAFESFDLADRVRVVDQHNGETIGHADVSSYRADPEPTVDLHIAETTRGNDVLALIENGTVNAVSVEFLPRKSDRIVDGVMRRANALVHGIAFAFRPAHTAPIIATRETKEETMTNETETVAGVTAEDLAGFGDELRRDIIEQFAIVGNAEAPDPFSHLRKFRSLSDFAMAAFDNDDVDNKSLNRALVDQVTTDNPGVVPPAWVQNVYGIIDRGRPCVTAFGVQSLPPAGMELNWPYYDGDFTALVGEQLTEKSEITSVLVPIEKGTAPVRTFAGGSDISMQLARRSSPSYLAAYERIMTVGYAAATDAAVVAAAIAAGTESAIPWIPDTSSAEDLMEALFAGSVQVEAATGAPAAFAVVSTDIYIAIGTLGVTQALVVPPEYGTQNVRGTASAGSLQVSISGIPIIHDQYAPAGTFIVSNDLAADFHEDGPMTISENEVSLLGINMAVWGMGAFAPVLPAGIIVVPTVAPPV